MACAKELLFGLIGFIVDDEEERKKIRDGREEFVGRYEGTVISRLEV
jgi:hypothetical protein